MKPTIGRVVIYNTTEQDKKAMTAASVLNGGCNVQDQLPAIVVAVWGEECINAKVITDGHLEIWVTSILQGTSPGQWEWPVIVQ
jgi:hypothetical protein